MISRMFQTMRVARFVKPHRLRVPVATERNEDLRVLAVLIEAAKVTPVIDRTYALSESAIRYLEQGHARDNVVITAETVGGPHGNGMRQS
jgi:NADPH:quinone reductase-like Zn-dependent oxidoreductase